MARGKIISNKFIETVSPKTWNNSIEAYWALNGKQLVLNKKGKIQCCLNPDLSSDPHSAKFLEQDPDAEPYEMNNTI